MASPEQIAICHMFDRIAPTYDSVNRVLSFGQDLYWRKKVTELVPGNRPLSVLDIATGTGDLLLSMVKRRPNIHQATGVDLSEKMLAIAQEKVKRAQLSNKISLSIADAAALPFGDNSFDIIAISFGIRNVTELNKALSEIHRVLKPGGQILILEFSLPKNYLIRALYLFYFRRVLPLVGGLISKDKNAYTYLNRTVEAFPYAKAFSEILYEAGFAAVALRPLTFGIATIYCAGKN